MLDFATFHLSKCNTACKKTFLNLWPNLSYLGIFGLELEKTSLLLYFTSAPPNFPKHKISSKIKILKFGTKIPLIMYFGLEFLKTNVVFEISILEFVNMKHFIQKQKNFKLGSKNTFFTCFWTEIWKYYCHNWNQHPRNCLTPKFGLKKKSLILAPKMSYLGIFELDFEKNNVMLGISTLEFV